jgi:phosphate transport system protein
MSEPLSTSGESAPSIDRRVSALRRRLLREATLAVSMLERALAALWVLDAEAARNVRLTDDQVDVEEVEIEQACHEVLALRAPYAHDFRVVTFVLRANLLVERVADHASSIAKMVQRIAGYAGTTVPPWPTALRELGERVPALCHQALRSVLDEDPEGARRIVAGDPVIDTIEKRLFEETLGLMRTGPFGENNLPIGILVYRVGRELERVGDLMADLAEDVVYMRTGEIIRHAKRRQTPPAGT